MVSRSRISLRGRCMARPRAGLLRSVQRREGRVEWRVEWTKRGLSVLRSWPGNIRELQNVIERSVILTDGATFSIDEAWLRRNAGPRPPVAGDGERQKIEAALAASKGRVSGPHGAAILLGIPRQTLESRIRALRINKHQFKLV